jgi:hypoxia up-regulated 1
VYTDSKLTTKFHSRILEKPIIHRYTEIEEFPKALNASQMWNWSARLFLTEARQNLTREEQDGVPGRFTLEDLDALEKTLKEHETWLNEWVEKQKSVKMNEDPVILTTEMKARAKTLENHLQRLVRKKAPKKPKTTATSSSSAAPAAAESASAETTTLPAEDASTTPIADATPSMSSAAASETTTIHDEL